MIFLYLFGIKKGTILIIAKIPNLRKEFSGRGLSMKLGNLFRSKDNSKGADLEVR